MSTTGKGAGGRMTPEQVEAAMARNRAQYERANGADTRSRGADQGLGRPPPGSGKMTGVVRAGRKYVTEAQPWHVIGDFQCPPIRFVTTTPPDRRRAIFRVRKVLPEVVHDTTALEGNPMTFPEVQTLLDGITVGGHRITDAEQVLNQAASWKRLLDVVSKGEFKPDAETACDLHNLVARNEALEWGVFRSGDVSIAGTDYKPPPANGLATEFSAATINLGQIPCIHTRAMATYLMMARQQFFWDGNKRTGRLMMNGMLMLAGHDAVCVPARRQQEFNEKMLAFYNKVDAEPMLMFLASCSLDKNLKRVEPERKRPCRAKANVR